MRDDGALLVEGAPVSTGTAALDYILGGGYAANHIHLIEGAPVRARRRSASSS